MQDGQKLSVLHVLSLGVALQLQDRDPPGAGSPGDHLPLGSTGAWPELWLFFPELHCPVQRLLASRGGLSLNLSQLRVKLGLFPSLSQPHFLGSGAACG